MTGSVSNGPGGFIDEVRRHGYSIIDPPLDRLPIESLRTALQPHAPVDGGGSRNLLDVPAIAHLAAEVLLPRFAAPILGPEAVAVRAILFDKTPAANWRVAWHQDLTVAVRERSDEPGYGPWSRKAGIWHVQAPVSVLEKMLAVRLHLDDCAASNGALRVLPGTHTSGRIPELEIPAWRARVEERVCGVAEGGVLLMRPLLLHASSPASCPRRRRVLHVECAAATLASSLAWQWEVPELDGVPR